MTAIELVQAHRLAGLSKVFAPGDASDVLTPFKNSGLTIWAKATGETHILIQWHLGPDLYNISQMCHLGMTCLLMTGTSQVQYMVCRARGRT